jgi:hypothetical protein
LKELDILYPVLNATTVMGSNIAGKLFQLLSFAGGPSPGKVSGTALRYFPLVFQQRSSDPNENYTALFPIYGHLKHRLFRDEIFFVLFPIYGQTKSTASSQIITYSRCFTCGMAPGCRDGNSGR